MESWMERPNVQHVFREAQEFLRLNSQPDLSFFTYAVVVLGLLASLQMLKRKLARVVQEHSAAPQGLGPSPIVRICLIFFPSVLTFEAETVVLEEKPASDKNRERTASDPAPSHRKKRSHRFSRRVSAVFMRSLDMAAANELEREDSEPLPSQAEQSPLQRGASSKDSRQRRQSTLFREEDLAFHSFMSDTTLFDLVLVLLGPAVVFLHLPATTAHVLQTAFRIGLGFRIVAPAAAACHELIVDIMHMVHVDRARFDATGFSHLSMCVRTVLWFVFFMSVLRQFGFDTTALVNGLGLGGIVVGLALQNMLTDFFAGLILLIDRWFNNGDLIVYSGMQCYVRDVGLRSTRLQTLEAGEYVYVPNSKLAGTHVINHDKRQKRRVCKNLILSPNADSETIMSVMDALNGILDRPSIFPDIEKYGIAPRWGTHLMGIDREGFHVEFIFYVLDGQDTFKWKALETEINLAIVSELRRLETGFGYSRIEQRNFA